MDMELRFTVQEDDLADVMRSGDLAVLATPRVLAWLEECCWRSVIELLGETETTVGTKADLEHLAASPLGAQVTCKAKLLERDGKRLIFEAEAEGNGKILAKGRFERFIVERERFLGKLAQK